MPRGLSAYAASKFGKKFVDLGKKFSQEFQAADDDEKGADRLAKLQSELVAAGRQGEFSASNLPQQSITISMYKEPAQATTALVKIYESLGKGSKISTIVNKKPEVADKAATYNNLTFTEVKLTFDFEATAEALPEPMREAAVLQLKHIMKEKTTLWIGTDGKAVVQLMAPDFAAAKKMLADSESEKDAIGAQEGFQLTRKNLPRDVSMVAMMETGSTVTMLVDQFKAMTQLIPGGGGLPPIGKVKPVSGAPTYLGMALTLKPQVAAADLFVPGSAMNVMTRMIAPLLRNVE